MAEIKRSVIIMMKNVWNVEELALVLGLSPCRVRRMAAEGDIPFYKQERRLYFKRDEIERWQTRNRVASNAEIEQEAATRIALGRLK